MSTDSVFSHTPRWGKVSASAERLEEGRLPEKARVEKFISISRVCLCVCVCHVNDTALSRSRSVDVNVCCGRQGAKTSAQEQQTNESHPKVERATQGAIDVN